MSLTLEPQEEVGNIHTVVQSGVCRVCGCVDGDPDKWCHNELTGDWCHWVEDDLCSECAA